MHEADGRSAAKLREALQELDDDTIAATVRRSALPPLLAALAQLSGDLSILRDDLRPDPTRVMEPHGGLSTQQRAMAADAATEMLYRLRDGVAEPPPTATDGLRELMGFTLGSPVTDEYLDLLLEELSVDGDDRRAPQWRFDDLAPGRSFLVVIIGAGMSGLLAGHRLAQAGVPYVIVEKNDDVGGTWFENRYPGCRVDVPNHLYSYSFAQRDDWSDHFTPRPRCSSTSADAPTSSGLREHIRFDTEVMTRPIERSGETGLSRSRGPDGATDTLDADVVVSAVGQLNRPRLPDIAGRETFRGPSFHSAGMGRGGRSHGQARRRRGDGGQRHPDHPGRRRAGGGAARVPTHAQLAAADPAVLPVRVGRVALAAAPRAVLQRVVPALAVLAALRRRPARGQGRRRLAVATRAPSARSTTGCGSC